jgi:hypothetical protein
MWKLLLAVAAVAVMAMPVVSSAQLQLGARLGYGFAMGEVVADVDQADIAKAQIPIQIDLNYKFSPNLSLGGYFSYAFGTLGDDYSDACDALDVDCSVSGMRLGIQLNYEFSPGASFNPWAGVATGYEWLSVEEDGESASFTGWEYLTLQVGADWEMSKGFGLGPFLSWGIGQYGSFEDIDIDDKGTHQLVQIGVRGIFSF